MQRYSEENLSDGGTIYYAVDDENGDTYVQAVDENQYQYTNEEVLEENNQEWEGSNQSIEQQQQQQQQEQEQEQQEQEQEEQVKKI